MHAVLLKLAYTIRIEIAFIVVGFLFSVGCALLDNVSRAEDSRLRTKLTGQRGKYILYSCERTQNIM